MARRLFSDYSTCTKCGQRVARSIHWMPWVHLDPPPDWPNAFYDHLPKTEDSTND